eukprot:4419672-Lingulodinium_polyedra.AAC.1
MRLMANGVMTARSNRITCSCLFTLKISYSLRSSLDTPKCGRAIGTCFTTVNSPPASAFVPSLNNEGKTVPNDPSPKHGPINRYPNSTLLVGIPVPPPRCQRPTACPTCPGSCSQRPTMRLRLTALSLVGIPRLG